MDLAKKEGVDPERMKAEKHLNFVCFMLNAEEGFSWQFTEFQTSSEEPFDFYHQWSGVL